MDQRLRRLVDIIFLGVEENYAEVKKDLEERGIFPDKLTEELMSKLEKMKVEDKISKNKKILELVKNTEAEILPDEDYKIAANFRKKENISAEDAESIEKDKEKLKLLEKAIIENERAGKGGGKENS